MSTGTEHTIGIDGWDVGGRIGYKKEDGYAMCAYVYEGRWRVYKNGTLLGEGATQGTIEQAKKACEKFINNHSQERSG